MDVHRCCLCMPCQSLSIISFLITSPPPPIVLAVTYPIAFLLLATVLRFHHRTAVSSKKSAPRAWAGRLIAGGTYLLWASSGFLCRFGPRARWLAPRGLTYLHGSCAMARLGASRNGGRVYSPGFPDAVFPAATYVQFARFPTVSGCGESCFARAEARTICPHC